MKELIKKYWWIIIIILITGFAFYWFQWRPVEIRKKCQRNIENIEYRDALKQQIKLKLGGLEDSDLYQNCLRQHGLEK